jgi:hypothetical protein
MSCPKTALLYTAQGTLVEHFIVNENPNEGKNDVKTQNKNSLATSCTNIFNDMNNLKIKYSCENTAVIGKNECEFNMKCQNT